MNKYIQKLRESIIRLNEAKQVGLLYHTTNKDGILGILESNSLISSRFNGISFSRDKNNRYNNGAFTLVFDGNKLSENNKLYPYSWYNVYPEDCIGAKDRNSEESLIPKGYKKQEFDSETFNLFGDTDYILKNIDKYLLGLIIYTNDENISFNEIQNVIYLFKTKYPDKYIQIK